MNNDAASIALPLVLFVAGVVFAAFVMYIMNDQWKPGTEIKEEKIERIVHHRRSRLFGKPRRLCAKHGSELLKTGQVAVIDTENCTVCKNERKV